MQQALLNKAYGFVANDIVWFILTVALLVISIATFRRKERWSVALLVGTAAYTVEQVFWWFVGVVGLYKMTHVDSQFAHVFYPACTPSEWVYTLKNALLFFSVLLPVGVVLWTIQYVMHLTKR
jgi:hypothetical protein